MSQRKGPVIAVVCGGSSAEAEVSRMSGREVAAALRRKYSQVVVFELEQGIGVALKAAGVDVVFPVLHGPTGEDGTFQGLLEIIGIPYVGSGIQASACAMDKIVAKQIFRAYGLPVARDVIVHRHEEISAAAQRVFLENLGTEVVVKPSRQGSALGVSFARDINTLEIALAQAFDYDKRVLVEECIKGKEITVALLERDGIEALPVIEVRTPVDSWYDYEHRYTLGLSEHVIPASLPPDLYLRTQDLAKSAHQVLGCRDLSRVDFIVPVQGNPVILEVNTLPGMTPTSLYPDAAQAAGISFEALVKYLVERAWSRATRKKM